MTLAEFAQSKGFTVDLLRRFGVRIDFDRIEVPYYDAAGKELARFQVRYNGASAWAWNKGDAPIMPYGLQRPVPYAELVFIVEGASDCWALWSAGFPALGIPGATATGCLRAEFVPVPEVVIVREPDAAGQRFPARVARRLWETGFAGRISVCSFEPHKDPRAALNHDASRFPSLVRGILGRRVEFSGERTRALGPPAVSSGVFLGDAAGIDYLIESLLPRKGSMLLGAQKKVGKSTTLLNLAKSVARGEPFLGRPTLQGRVLYISLDEPATITKARAKALGIADDDAIDWVSDRRVPQDWVRWLRDLVAAKPYALIVIDTLAKLLGIEDLNSYGEWNRKLAPLHSMSEEFGCAWAGSAHARKSSEGSTNDVAGSSALLAGVDSILVERRLPGGVRTLESEQRDGADLEATLLQMDSQTYALTLGESQSSLRDRTVDARILAALGNGPVRGNVLIDQTQIRRTDFWSGIERLLRDSLIIRTEAGYAIQNGSQRSPEVPQGSCLFFIGGPGGGLCRRCGIAWEAHP